jgi:hypothetical protein
MQVRCSLNGHFHNVKPVRKFLRTGLRRLWYIPLNPFFGRALTRAHIVAQMGGHFGVGFRRWFIQDERECLNALFVWLPANQHWRFPTAVGSKPGLVRL